MFNSYYIRKCIFSSKPMKNYKTKPGGKPNIVSSHDNEQTQVHAFHICQKEGHYGFPVIISETY